VYCFQQKKRIKLLQALHRRAALVRTYPDAFGHLLAIDGRMDVMVDPWAYVWDFAPCKILAQEAGGAFINFTGNKNSICEGTALVGNAKLVKALQRSIQTTQAIKSSKN
jgi:fructose-1,6-bisphosphatase/inositol monophosphatase family enzyme